MKNTEGKTIREWLNELPEPDNKKAIRYYEQNHEDEPMMKVGSLLFALFSAFPWGFTDEGYEYWAKYAYSEVMDELSNNQQND